MSEIKPLTDLLTAAGWRRRGSNWRTPSGENVALIGPTGFEVKVFAADRHVEALLSQALLEAAAAGLPSVATLVLKRVSPSQHERCVEFTRRVAPHAPWILADMEGRCFVHAFGEYAAPEPRRAAHAKQQINLFSDLHQWLAKVLLASALPERLLNAPRGHYRSAFALAEAAGVSVPATTRFVRALSEQGWLDEDDPGLMIQRPADYLQWWAENLASARSHPYQQDLLVRSARGPLDDQSVREILRLETIRAGIAQQPGSAPDFWLAGGLFTACNELGFGHVQGALPTLVIPHVNEAALASRGLVIDGSAKSGAALLRVSRFPESVRRGSVVANGVRVTDVIQCWLDARRYAVRGQEQADYLWRKVIAPALKGSR